MNEAALPDSPLARDRPREGDDGEARSPGEDRRRDPRDSAGGPPAGGSLVGRALAGRYRVTRRIGRGGMGEVYEAEHTGIGETVAIKILHPDAAELEGVAGRFAREARIVSRLESEHIVSVLDAGADADGRPYLVMELLRGEDLGTRLRARRALPEADAIHVVAQILRGLADAHEAGVIHRDLKPDNVFLTTRGGDDAFVKLVDFGISKVQRLDATSPLALTQAGTILGTPMYMSPEQAQAKGDIDARTDIYSVGAILFECLAGRPPHVGETDAEVLLKLCTSDVPDLRALAPSTSPAVRRLVARALSRDRDARFRSARQMLVAVSQLGAAAPAKAEAPPAVTLPVRERPTDLDVPPVAAAPAVESKGRPSAAERASRPSAAASRARVAAIAIVATLSGGAVTAWVVTSRRAPSAGADLAATAEPPFAASVATSPASATTALAPASATSGAGAAGGGSAAPPAKIAPAHEKPKARPPPRGGLDLERDLE